MGTTGVDWKTICDEARHAYESLNNTVTSQQQRISSVLVTNGLVFAFLGSSAGTFLDRNVNIWVSILFVVSILFLGAGIIAALRALWPNIPPTDEYLFLNPGDIVSQGSKCSKDELLERLSDSIKENAQETLHIQTVLNRRILIFIQLVCIGGGVIFLFAALVLLLLSR
jgi:hypothetical protein